MAKEKVRDVLLRFHKRVPFPLTAKKIKKKGLDVQKYLLEIANAVQECEDFEDSDFQEFIDNLNTLRKLTQG